MARLTRSRLALTRALGLGAGAGITALCFEMYWDTWQAFAYNAMLWLILGLLVAALRIEPSANNEDVELAAGVEP